MSNLTKLRMGFVPVGFPFVSPLLVRKWTTDPTEIQRITSNPGFVVELALEICQAAFSTLECEFVLLNHTGYGTKDGNGTWTGMVADVVANRIDCSMPELDRNRDRESVVAYTNDIRRAPLNAVTRFHSNVRPSLLAFSFRSAMAALALALAVTLILSIPALGNFHRWGRSFVSLLGETLLCLIQRSWVSTLNDGTHDGGGPINYRKTVWKSLQGTLIVWNAGCFVLGAIYAGMIVKTLLTPKKDFPFRSFEQMADCFGRTAGNCIFMVQQVQSNLFSIMTARNGTAGGLHFRNVSRRLAESPVFVSSYLNSLGNSIASSMVANDHQYFVEFISADGLSTLLERDAGKCTYYVHEMRYYSPQGIGCRKGDPRIQLLNTAIHKAQVHGLLWRIYNRYNHLDKLMDYQSSVCYHPEIVLDSLNLYQLSDAVYPIFFFLALAIVALISERFLGKRKQTHLSKAAAAAAIRKDTNSSRAFLSDVNFLMRTKSNDLGGESDDGSMERARRDIIEYLQTAPSADLMPFLAVLNHNYGTDP